jgi:quercetin dioxygenase-like cupin family protein
MFDQEILASQVSASRFPFPCEGDISLAVRNKNYALGPVMLHLVMKPGATIPAHIHEGVAEVLYVVEGDFINEGKQYQPGTSLHVKAGKPHGPHSTENGCTLLVLWTDKAATQDANLADFEVAETAAAGVH